MERQAHWRDKLIGADVQAKRELYYAYVQTRTDIPASVRHTIEADMPRTFAQHAEVRAHIHTVKKLLIAYAAVHRGDSYLQGFNYLMAVLWHVFKDAEHAEADTWWCFVRIVGLVRPLMPDFNVTWFHWMRRHWLSQFHKNLKRKRPKLESVLSNQTEEFSCLVTVKWFMLWFANTVAFNDVFKLWDFIIEQPPRLLMKVYTLVTLEILYEAAPGITYKWAQEPTRLMHAFLSLKVEGIDHAIEEVRRAL